jgi:L-alanine-DL-glutamate epimerase-like enolase superfamily enzyme
MPHASAHDLDLRTAPRSGAAGSSAADVANYIVELRAGGLTGRGEAAPSPRFGESREEGKELIVSLAPDIADLNGPAAVEALCERLGGESGALRPALRAALSAAAWDLAGKQAGEPVWRMLGLERPSAHTSRTIARAAPGDMLAQAREAAAFDRLRVELGFEGDLEVARMLALARPDAVFRYDAGEAWDRERAATSLAVLADLGAELVEQPLSAADPEGTSWLKERTSVPLLADEAVLTLEDLDAAAETYDGVVVKLAKAGGIAAAFALVSACKGRGLQVLLGSMAESSLGIGAAVHLAGLADYVDLDGAHLLAEDPFAGIELDGDSLRAPDAPGLGVSPSA